MVESNKSKLKEEDWLRNEVRKVPACMITVTIVIRNGKAKTRTAKKKTMASVMKKVHNLSY